MVQYRMSKNQLLITHAGFTLLEVMISLLLMSGLMVSVYQIVDQSSNTGEKIMREDRPFIELQSALQRIESDLQSLFSPLYAERPFDYSKDEKSFASLNEVNTNSDRDGLLWTPTEKYPQRTYKLKLAPAIDSTSESLSFMTFNYQRLYSNEKRSRYQWVRYEWRTQTATQEEKELGISPPSDRLELLRSTDVEKIYTEQFRWKEIKPYVVLRNIKSIKFFYWSPSRRTYVSSVQDLPAAEKYQLLGIKMELEWIDQALSSAIPGQSNDDSSASTQAVTKITKFYRPLWKSFNWQDEEKELNTLRQQWQRYHSQNNNNNNQNSPQGTGYQYNPNGYQTPDSFPNDEDEFEDVDQDGFPDNAGGF